MFDLPFCAHAFSAANLFEGSRLGDFDFTP
jgi:hypothetical protein